MTWLFLAAAIAAEVLATGAMRAVAQPNAALGWWAVVIGGYLAAFALLYAALSSGAPLAIAYAIWAGVGVAATAGVAALVFHERLSPWSLSGIAVIIAGVVMVELGQRVSEASA